MKASSLIVALALLSSCLSTSTLVKELAKDEASACLSSWGGPYGIRFGTIYICRSNEPGSVLEIRPDGSMRLQHGK